MKVVHNRNLLYTSGLLELRSHVPLWFLFSFLLFFLLFFQGSPTHGGQKVWQKNKKKGKKARTQKQQSKKEEVKQKKNSLEEKEVTLKCIYHEKFILKNCTAFKFFSLKWGQNECIFNEKMHL